ncbi:MAG: GAF domain-containing protein [Acidobacteria bacterium]|nr:GAF domain-containing protein [Acidobacteriota bacterium]
MQSNEKRAAYQSFIETVRAVLEDEKHPVTKMATIACLGKQHLPTYFWVGFYCMVEGELVVGPYQGSLGCLRIALGRGVCGASAAQRKTLVVEDVHAFADHIACDAASNSEIVVPILNKQGELLGVFDVDSTEFGSFDAIDQEFLEALMNEHFSDCDRLM